MIEVANHLVIDRALLKQHLERHRFAWRILGTYIALLRIHRQDKIVGIGRFDEKDEYYFTLALICRRRDNS